MLSELVVLALLILFLLTFPRLLFRTWTTGRYGGVGASHKPRVHIGPGLFVTVLQGTVQLARYIAESILGPVAAAGNRRVIRVASERQDGHHQSWTDRLRHWHYRWTANRSAPPPPAQPGFLDYTPDEFDPWGGL